MEKLAGSQEAGPEYSIISRRGVGTTGRRIRLLTNHFKVSVDSYKDVVFYQYSVSITSEDNKAVEGKEIGRKLIGRLSQTYSSELADEKFVYDGEKSLYTAGPLPHNKFEFQVVLEESIAICDETGTSGGTGSPKETGKRLRHSLQSKTFKVELSYAAQIPLRSIAQDALIRVLDSIWRQQATDRDWFWARQSFFCDDPRYFIDIGGGVQGARGFRSSFQATQGGLSLNMDLSTTLILKPGPVIDFLVANQNVPGPHRIDWLKAKRMLKNLRVKTLHRNAEFKIIGLSEKPCNEQLFPLKVKNGESGNEGQSVEITVLDYFAKRYDRKIVQSANLPCLDVGKPKRPTYLPLELCSLVSLQRYTKALSSMQRAYLVENSRKEPEKRIQILTDNYAMKNYRYHVDPILDKFGISIAKRLTRVGGRVLETPKLMVGNSDDCIPHNGRWDFNNKQFWKPVQISSWIVVNFSARCRSTYISKRLIESGRNKGIHIRPPHTLIEEDEQTRRASPVARVEKMFERVMGAQISSGRQLEFILCVLSEKKNSEIYGPWKKKSLCDHGIFTQCISPNTKVNDQYLTNVLLKINSKLGGINSLLAIEQPSSVPLIRDTPTLILGMDVSHGSPGRSDIPSIAAVVGSQCWPLISRYRASVRTQSPKVEMIEALYKPLEDGSDDGIIRELLEGFHESIQQTNKSAQIILFRDGVSESQFNQVLNIELDQIIKACQQYYEGYIPKFTVIVAQKNHHTKLFQAGCHENVPPGTVVDTNIAHPRNYDFYMCAHAGMIGTSRPTHYHVLVDEIGFSPNELQNLIHSLSYVYQRSTTAISIVAPIRYAHLAAHQMGQIMKVEDLAETSSGSDTSVESTPISELPRLHENVRKSMFFC